MSEAEASLGKCEPQLPERVSDPLRVSPVGEDVDEQSAVAEPVGQIPQQERSRIPAQTFGPGLHPDAAGRSPNIPPESG